MSGLNAGFLSLGDKKGHNTHCIERAFAVAVLMFRVDIFLHIYIPYSGSLAVVWSPYAGSKPI